MQDEDGLSSAFDHDTTTYRRTLGDGIMTHSSRPSTKSKQGFLDKLTKDVTDAYYELLGSAPIISSPQQASTDLNQQLEDMEMMSEDMMDKIVMYCELLERIRADTSETLNQRLPKTYEIVQRMEELYRRIDSLEVAVSAAKRCTASVEDAVVRAEQELMPTKSQSFKTFLENISPFVLPKNTSNLSFAHYEEPLLFVSAHDHESAETMAE